MSEWYYVAGEEKKGPVSAEELRSLARAGSIVNATLVWRPGLSRWVPAHVVKGMFSEHAQQAAPPPLPITREPEAPQPSAIAGKRTGAPPGARAATTGSGPTTPAVKYCRTCARAIAPQAVACIGCGCAPESGRSFCHACGHETRENAIVCVQCGSGLQTVSAEGTKSRTAAGVLALLLGSLGVHNFYLGHPGRGVLQALLSLFGIFTFGISTIACYVWAIFEGIAILSGRVQVDGQGKPLRP